MKHLPEDPASQVGCGAGAYIEASTLGELASHQSDHKTQTPAVARKYCYILPNPPLAKAAFAAITRPQRALPAPPDAL